MRPSRCRILMRNTLIFTDQIRQNQDHGMAIREAIIEATVRRARPVILTALAAMLGALFILDDPIFGGLAVALIAGLGVSTVLTLLVIPVVYYAYHYQRA